MLHVNMHASEKTQLKLTPSAACLALAILSRISCNCEPIVSFHLRNFSLCFAEIVSMLFSVLLAARILLNDCDTVEITNYKLESPLQSAEKL